MAECPTVKGLWPWPWIASYCIPSRITHLPLSTYQTTLKSKKVLVDGRTYGQTYGWTDVHLRPTLLGRLRGVDLTMPENFAKISKCTFNVLVPRWNNSVTLSGIHVVHCVTKNDTALACYNFDVHRPISIILAETLLLHSLVKQKHKHCMFSLKCCITLLSVAAWFLQLCSNAAHIHAAIDSLNLVINWVQLWPIETIAQELTVLHSSYSIVLHAPCADECMSCVAESIGVANNEALGHVSPQFTIV